MVESGWPVRNEPHEFPVRGRETVAMPLHVSIINVSGTTAKYWSYSADAASSPAHALVMVQQTCFQEYLALYASSLERSQSFVYEAQRADVNATKEYELT